ncbi:hypothetical protein V8F33_009892, partial [Rhypophila sp. PSN 637]
SIARISRFARETPDEASTAKNFQTTLDWPKRGGIRVEDLSLSYGPHGPPALDHISFSISPGEHVAICGRSGSGKSTLVASLLRLTEPSTGRILINDVDLSTLPPNMVRSHLTVVTQEPYLFPGTVRENFNPRNEVEANTQRHTNEVIMDVLNQVGILGVLKCDLSNNGLDGELDANSLSHGQSQLFCLARAVLRQSQVVVLDEPTSSLDSATEDTLLRIIRQEFGHRTVVMITHRLRSVLDFDKVVLLDSGRLIEMGPPTLLLHDKRSAFSKLYYGAAPGRVHDGDAEGESSEDDGYSAEWASLFDVMDGDDSL